MGLERHGQLDKASVTTESISQILQAMTAGTVYEGFLTPHPILDANADDIGYVGNSSFSATGGVFTNEVATIEDVTNNGDYFIRYVSGKFKVKAAASATPTATFKVKTLNVEAELETVDITLDRTKLSVLAEGEITVTTAGTPVSVPTNASARAVFLENNNTDGTLFVVGLTATVDALSSPIIGRVLQQFDATIIHVAANSNEVAVDSSVSAKKIFYQILG